VHPAPHETDVYRPVTLRLVIPGGSEPTMIRRNSAVDQLFFSAHSRARWTPYTKAPDRTMKKITDPNAKIPP